MKTIVITGTSAGLGLGFYRALQSTEHGLICVARRFLPWQEENAAEFPDRIRLVNADLAAPGLPWRAALEREVRELPGEEYVFISNAGTVDPIGSLGTLADDAIVSSIAVNLTSPLVIANMMGRIACESQSQLRIVNISSGAAKRPIAGWMMYCGTKAGSFMSFDVVRISSGGKCTVVHVDPGVLDTRMQACICASDATSFPERDKFRALQAGGLLRNPDEVALRIVAEHVLG